MSQQFLLVLKSLYAANGLVGVSLYIPQILRAWRDKNQALSLSVVTFGGWSIGSLITTLYAWFYARDLLFAALSVCNMLAAGTLFLLIVHTRLAARKALQPRFLQWVPRTPYRPQTPRIPLQLFLSDALCTIR